ncbi:MULTISPECIES: hypothetical protein [unclassified Ruegeria]|uniref:hypothetical protein n=1 Tax=unclassified Ruegeria TaxID=2625375 RepID=UPI00148882BA|nr:MULTISPECIES: hypothetical protein [unclassified Ruegeria]NOD88747.1 hypothetical protein [Ruegeria sp. HKCCD4318]NOE16142.1 hypothetical protein [Ruegeria sp. HKCCD4318-2]NOG09811.1 hypothetical protein [Ruegeria sp. HKCCD4315]
MSIKRRVKKLEASSPNALELPIVFYQIYGIKKGTEGTSRVVEREHGPATIPGLSLGRICPHKSESQCEFERRVFAIKAGGKHIEGMTKEERETAFAAADRVMRGRNNDD